MNKKPLKKLNYVIVSLVAIALEIAIDQITKVVAFQKVAMGDEVDFIGKMFTISPMYNKVASLGLGSSFAQPNVVFFVATAIGLPLFVIWWWFARTRSSVGVIGCVMCIGGTIGNAIDRFVINTEGEFFGGEVRDFMCWNIIPSKVDGKFVWQNCYTNNVADDFLVVGMVLIVLALLFFDHDSLVKSLRAERLQKQNSQQEVEKAVNENEEN